MKAYTNLEQSEKLAKILPLESADMYYFRQFDVESIYSIPLYKDGKENFSYDIPCWSLSALLDVLPSIEGFRPIIDLDINLIRYEGNYRDKLCFNENNLIDACYELIVKLKENNLL